LNRRGAALSIPATNSDQGARLNTRWAETGLAAALVLAASSYAQEQERQPEPQRQMGVRQAPDTVFAEPVATLVPELAGATATEENGRVGNELVFWGYTLGDGRPVFLYACAPSDLVNCEERVQLICVERTQVLRSASIGGNVTRRVCSGTAIVAPGDIRPGCVQNEQQRDLAVGLVSCG
jgi:hypothetical protein